MSKNIEMLIQAGLTKYEAKTYNVLLTIEKGTASEIGQKAGIPRSKTYEILNSLVQKGFCSLISGNIKQYKATNPKYAFNNIIEDLKKKEEDINKNKDYFLDIYKQFRSEDISQQFIEIIYSKQGLIQKVEEFLKETDNSVLTFQKPPYFIPVNDADWQNQEEYSINKKIHNRTIIQATGDFIKEAELAEKNGEEVRIAEQLPMKFLIFDNHSVIFLLTNENQFQENFAFLAIRNRGLAETLTNVFNDTWKKGLSVSEYK